MHTAGAYSIGQVGGGRKVPDVGDRHLGGTPALSDLQDHRPGVSRQFPLQLHGSPEEGPAPGEEARAGRGEKLVERSASHAANDATAHLVEEDPNGAHYHDLGSMKWASRPSGKLARTIGE